MKSNPFVIGDRVIRSNNTNGYPFPGKVVTVVGVIGYTDITVDGDRGGWDVTQFTKVDPPVTLPNMSTFTDAELRRLTALTVTTMNVGECFANSHREDFGHMKALFTNSRGWGEHQIVSSRGKASDLSNFDKSALRRRVASVVNLTELDPSQADMLLEIERRRSTGIKNGPIPVFARVNYAGQRVWVLTETQAKTYNRGLDLNRYTIVANVDTGYVDTMLSVDLEVV